MAEIYCETAEGDATITLSPEALRDIIPLAASLTAVVRPIGSGLTTFPIEGLSVLHDAADDAVLLKIGLRMGAPMMTFEIPPPLLETLKTGLARIDRRRLS
jgi:hypothetical protein